MKSCDLDWGNGESMLKDLRQRIPLALKDGNIKYNKDKLDNFLYWLGNYRDFFHIENEEIGATMVYKIST